jgi:superfamily II helicase
MTAQRDVLSAAVGNDHIVVRELERLHIRGDAVPVDLIRH